MILIINMNIMVNVTLLVQMEQLVIVMINYAIQYVKNIMIMNKNLVLVKYQLDII